MSQQLATLTQGFSVIIKDDNMKCHTFLKLQVVLGMASHLESAPGEAMTNNQQTDNPLAPQRL